MKVLRCKLQFRIICVRFMICVKYILFSIIHIFFSNHVNLLFSILFDSLTYFPCQWDVQLSQLYPLEFAVLIPNDGKRLEQTWLLSRCHREL